MTIIIVKEVKFLPT